MRVLLLVLAVSVVGCGGLSPDFFGEWTGSMLITVDTLTLSNAGVTVLIANDGTGGYDLMACSRTARMPLTGAGSRAEWSGIQSCPNPTDSCPSATTNMREATLTLLSSKRMTFKSSGSISHCGDTWGFSTVFDGTK